MHRIKLIKYLNELLKPEQFKDYCPNGLQIQGKDSIAKIICGVSLSNELIDIAIAKNADAIIVHHGIFWNKDNPALTGVKYQRIAKLIKHDINLFAYHLPLDCHLEYGNNAQLAKQLNLVVDGQTSSQNLLWYGHLETAMTKEQLIAHYIKQTGHTPQYFGASDKQIKNVAWCTGGADSMLGEAVELGVDCFISGEVSEPIKALAEESGVAYLAGGHYVTERYGIMALSKVIQDNLNIPTEFIELYNPI